MKNKITNTILILIFIGGISLLLYPTISDYWNSFHQSQAISEYSEKIAVMDDKEYDKILQDAKDYNKRLRENNNQYAITDQQAEEYNGLLDVSGLGVMAYIEIPKIDCTLPIYHGVDDAVLQVAIGHLPWTSLPTGGAGNHIVVSGHRGLPSAKLLTDLDKMDVDDIFIIRVLNEVLTYEVESILIVEPQEIDSLVLVPEQDLCTLVTCTPYGVNSHRLLVTGHRIENRPEHRDIRVAADAVQIEPLVVAPMVAIPIILLLLGGLFIYNKKKQ